MIYVLIYICKSHWGLSNSLLRQIGSKLLVGSPCMQTQKSHSDDDDDGDDDGGDDVHDKMEILEMALMPMAMMMRKTLFYLSLYSPS